MTYDGRVEAQMTVPAGVQVSATNNGGGPTAVTLTPGTYFPTTLLTQLAADLNATRPPLDYPLSAAAMNTAIGGYTWSAGWLCNEASGNLAAVFGSPTLVAAGPVTYGITGPRGGTDKAVGFGVTGRFDGGANFDVSATDDLIVAWVGRYNAAPTATATLFSKVAASFTNGWAVAGIGGGGAITFEGGASAASTASGSSAGAFIGQWHVGIAALDRAAGKLRIGTRSLSTGVADLSTENAAAANTWSVADTFLVGESGWTLAADTNFQLAGFYIGKGAGVAGGATANMATALANFANAINAGWTATLSTGANGTGKVTIDCIQAPTTATHALAWTSTALRDNVGFTADIAATAAAQTGTKQCHGLFIPDCPLQLKGDPKRAPKGSDHRRSVSPKGRVFGIVGTTYRRLREAQYMAVARGRVWEAEAAVANGSWETFYLETQLGQMSSWFTPSSLVQIYDHTGTLVGIDANSGTGLPGGWGLSNPTPLDELEQHIDQYTGLVKIVLGDLYSDG